MNEIETKLRELAEARRDLMQAKLAQADILEAAKQCEAYRTFEAKRLNKSLLVDELERDVKNWGIANFDGQNKKVHAKVNIKTFDVSKVTYDKNKARNWCISNFTPALKLDEKLFENSALDGTIPAEIATVTFATEDRAQIASDLSEYLEQ